MEFNYIGRVLTQQYYLFNENNLYNLRKKNSIERYKLFINEKKHLVERLPQHIIAFYLGIDIATLSRLKKQ